MNIAIQNEAGKIVINVEGAIDEKGAEELKSTFGQLQTAPTPFVVLNLSRVDHIGSSGIGKILLFYKNLAIKNSRLEVTGLSPMLFELFRELKLDSLFSLAKR
ncbi:MAG: STAS domain-containing protein [Proteobacteria bacterium]|nr:STAS domain-containing protein [Desulfobulbaceae bacterium]MBU4154252.1 STAS domain-containing protein [Pseudomonadota bacterium]